MASKNYFELFFFLDQKCARNDVLLLRISKMSIDMRSGIVHCVCVDKANDGQSECKSRVGFKEGDYHKKNK